MTTEKATSAHERAKRLRYLRKDLANLSREQLSEKSGIALNTIRNWEQALNSGLTSRGAKLLLTIYQVEGIDCTEEWLLYGIGRKPELFNSYKAGSMKIKEGLLEEEIIQKELEVFRQLNRGAIDAIVRDDSMIPRFWPGDYVAGKQYFGESIKKYIGLPCIIVTQSETTLVRIIEEADDEGYYNLVCSNSNSYSKTVMEKVKVKSVAPILWLRRREYDR